MGRIASAIKRHVVFAVTMIGDERADETQRTALQVVFGGQAGGWPKRFGVPQAHRV